MRICDPSDTCARLKSPSRALHELYLSPGKSVADVPSGTSWEFGHSGCPTKAILTDGDHSYSIRVIGVLRECCFDNVYPHCTIMPLFERDANVFSAVFNDPTAQDWEIEPGMCRLPSGDSLGGYVLTETAC